MKKIILFLIMSALSFSLFAGIKFTPIQLYLGDKNKQQRSTTVIVESSDFSQSKIFELSASTWTQNEKGEDVLLEEKNILFNPKIFELKPNSKQIVRIGFIQSASGIATDKEKAWRIIFNEVTPITDPQAMNIQFKFSLPLFVGQQDKNNLKVDLKKMNNKFILDLENNSKSHVQLNEVELIDANNKELVKKSLNKYLLSGSKYQLDLGVVNNGSNEKIKVRIKTDKDGDFLEY
ncbi:molecular chaperone [Acinetobacter sp. ANC 4173]|uniref:fimbrial biogenesis chaperone n=1 Tax=Acinetobacter sp. ANC 4173 TaxID=2529837 RepID=UPI00103EBBC5|nr:fimbria/pilus periplasmic chaperone [Acinetobacter sp. ANC 4173]TCB78886.1 molecular chaperone [Acinetobacter sp. ANC 4173]